jgi:hypothetical protein
MRLPRVRVTVRWLIAAVAILAITFAVTSRLVVPIARDVLERAEGKRWAREDASQFPPGGWTYDEWWEESERRAAGLPPHGPPHRMEPSAEVIGLVAGLLMVALLTAGLRLGRRALQCHGRDDGKPSGASPGL